MAKTIFSVHQHFKRRYVSWWRCKKYAFGQVFHNNSQTNANDLQAKSAGAKGFG
jgi:hypothetical protein